MGKIVFKRGIGPEAPGWTGKSISVICKHHGMRTILFTNSVHRKEEKNGTNDFGGTKKEIQQECSGR
jgi:hypothetical protein